MLKLISEKYHIFYQSITFPTELCSSVTSTIFEPEGKVLALGFGGILSGETFPKELISELIKKQVGIIYFCDKVPNDKIIDPHIVYVTAEWAWYSHTAIVDYYKFNYVFSSGRSSENLALKFSRLGEFKCKIIKDSSEVKNIESTESLIKTGYKLEEKTMLFDIVSFCADRGLGDILMTTIPLRELAKQGWKIDYIGRKSAVEILKNNPYINKLFISTNNLAKLSKDMGESMPKPTDYSWYFTLATNLEDYRIPRNLNGRIDSLCELLKVDINKIEDFTPEFNLTPEELEYGKQYRKENKINIALGLISTGSDRRSYPLEYIEPLLSKLNNKDIFNILVMDQHHYNLTSRTNIINLTGQLSVREWASVVANSDMVVSMDTGIYWLGLAFKRPALVFFTTIDPEIRINHHLDLCKGIYLPLACKPCYDRQMVRDKDAWKLCTEAGRFGRPAPCTKELTPTLVVKHIKEFAKNRKLI